MSSKYAYTLYNPFLYPYISNLVYFGTNLRVKFYSIYVCNYINLCIFSFAELLDFKPDVAHLLFNQPTKMLPKFDEAAIRVQVLHFVEVYIVVAF